MILVSFHCIRRLLFGVDDDARADVQPLRVAFASSLLLLDLSRCRGRWR